MKPLELEPLKKKDLKVVMVGTEFPVPWSTDSSATDEEWNLRLLSDAYLKMIEKLAKKNAPAFALEEKGSRQDDAFFYDNPLVDTFKRLGIPHAPVDITEEAASYIDSALDPARELLSGLKGWLKTAGSKKEKSDMKLQEAVLKARYLEEEIAAKEKEVRVDVRDAWIVSGLLERAAEVDGKEVTAMLVCNEEHFPGIAKIAEQLGVDVTQYAVEKRVKTELGPDSVNIDDILTKSMLDVVPVKIKDKKSLGRLLYMFDTDDHASPFDINMAYDAGFDAVFPFSGVTAKSVTRLVQDAMFSRKPSAPTAFFIGGSNVDECNEIGEKVKAALVPPFEHPVVVDPRGANTTAAAVVAKTLKMITDADGEGLKDKKVAILGAGPVAQVAAIIAANEGARVTIIETWEKAKPDSIGNLAARLNEIAGGADHSIKGLHAPAEDGRHDVLDGSDVIWALATAGVEVVSKKGMEALSPGKFVIDINAVPPAGIAGLKPRHENKEIYPGIIGTGSLALGGLKYTTESSMLAEAAKTKGMKLFDHGAAFKTAKVILFGKKVVLTT